MLSVELLSWAMRTIKTAIAAAPRAARIQPTMMPASAMPSPFRPFSRMRLRATCPRTAPTMPSRPPTPQVQMPRTAVQDTTSEAIASPSVSRGGA
jgi:hypothetical protein